MPLIFVFFSLVNMKTFFLLISKTRLKEKIFFLSNFEFVMEIQPGDTLLFKANSILKCKSTSVVPKGN